MSMMTNEDERVGIINAYIELVKKGNGTAMLKIRKGAYEGVMYLEDVDDEVVEDLKRFSNEPSSVGKMLTSNE